jgi:hypothetical protein
VDERGETMSAPEEKEIQTLRALCEGNPSTADVKCSGDLYGIHMIIRQLVRERNHARSLVAELFPQSFSETAEGMEPHEMEIEALIEKWKRDGTINEP